MDYFSKYIEAKSLENKTGSAVGAFLYDLICRYAVMDIAITDQDMVKPLLCCYCFNGHHLALANSIIVKPFIF